MRHPADLTEQIDEVRCVIGFCVIVILVGKQLLVANSIDRRGSNPLGFVTHHRFELFAELLHSLCQVQCFAVGNSYTVKQSVSVHFA